MVAQNREHIHNFYTDRPRHWCPVSEKYTGGDSLYTALRNGWVIVDNVIEEVFWYGGRRATVFHFPLKRDNERVTMSVTSSPWVTGFIQEAGLVVVAQDNAQWTESVRA